MNTKRIHAVIAMFAVLAAVWCTPAAFAQGDTAAISGYVRDASGAVVPGAPVVIRNEATQVERRSSSNESGYYVISGLAPATYTVSVSAVGFKRADKTGITLTSGIGVNADIALAVGETSEVVEVIADSATVQTETAMVGKTVTTTQINNLQLNGRNPLFLALLKPGVRGGSLAGFNRGLTSGGFSINGSRSQDNLITFDGAVAVRTRSNGTSIGVADLDSTQEVQILTASYTAEYGRSAGGQIRIVTKSGTNELHGAMYEYLRNEKLDANSWQNNRNGAQRNPFRYNQFGYNVSGPVFIPKFYDGRNKFFWLWSQEWIKFRQQQTVIRQVPTLNARGLNSAGAQVPINLSADEFAGRSIKDPTTGVAFVNNQIPVNRFSNNGVAMLRAFPLPNFQQGTNNWFAQGSATEDHRKDTVAFDFVPTENKFFKFRWQNYEFADFQPFFGNYGVVKRTFERPNDTASLGFTWTVNPTTINETLVTASADRVIIDYDRQSSQLDRGVFGINYPYLFPDGKEIPTKIPTVVLGNGINDLDGGPLPGQLIGPHLHDRQQHDEDRRQSHHQVRHIARTRRPERLRPDQCRGRTGRHQQPEWPLPVHQQQPRRQRLCLLRCGSRPTQHLRRNRPAQLHPLSWPHGGVVLPGFLESHR
ncbi:MAG: carboxypeptidase regulatory-like domain-containing protein [Bryobacterales bacterium]|nr:carboxypeptidase regulatory-like domain-containing protein [Bryobacterales bacterium]